jgi:hypothetical protein
MSAIAKKKCLYSKKTKWNIIFLNLIEIYQSKIKVVFYKKKSYKTILIECPPLRGRGFNPLLWQGNSFISLTYYFC